MRLAHRASNIDMAAVKDSISSAGTKISAYIQDMQVLSAGPNVQTRYVNNR